eukprot:scaffold2003_cov139-Cylindrotheca_fusiformis.AAC.20
MSVALANRVRARERVCGRKKCQERVVYFLQLATRLFYDRKSKTKSIQIGQRRWMTSVPALLSPKKSTRSSVFIYSVPSHAFMGVSQTTLSGNAWMLGGNTIQPIPSNRMVICQMVENDADGEIENNGIEAELQRLQDQLSSIEALEARNEAQLDSFVNEEDQWNSMEAEEQNLLKSKDEVIEKMETLAEQMVVLWMGQKSQEG